MDKLLEKLNNFLGEESYQPDEEITIEYDRICEDTPNKMVEFTTLSGRKALMYTNNGCPILVKEKVTRYVWEPFYENIMKCVSRTENIYHSTPCIDVETGKLFCLSHTNACEIAYAEEDDSELIENLELLQAVFNE